MAQFPNAEQIKLIRATFVLKCALADLEGFVDKHDPDGDHPEHLFLPIYLYEHSGITISTSSFRDIWDSGQVGWIYIEAKDIDSEFGDRLQAQKCLEAEVEEYDTYLRGEVYGYTIKKDDDDIDSCWGMYGYDYCKEAAINVIDSYQIHVAKHLTAN